MLGFRKKVYKIIEPSQEHTGASYAFDLIIISLIILNVLAMIIGSEPNISEDQLVFLELFETISVVIFTIEYLLRIWTVSEHPDHAHGFFGRIKFMLTPMAIVDLLAILPFYLPFVGIDLRFLRVLRLFRVFRLLKMARYSQAFDTIKKVILNKKEDLAVTTIMIMIVLIIASTLMYYVEGEVQPEHFSSITKSIWWGVCTITTVGYGDVVPITPTGKVLGGFLTVLGIALIALPSGILASGYTEQRMKDHEDNK